MPRVFRPESPRVVPIVGNFCNPRQGRAAAFLPCECTANPQVPVAPAARYIMAFAQSAEPWVGTWRLNVAKSKYSPGPGPRSQTVRIDAVANGQKVVTDAVDAQGMATHTEITAMFDGKEYELKGAAVPTTRVYRRIDARSYDFVNRVGGKVTTTVRSVVSADGKTRTNTTTGTDPRGRTVNNVAVYEKQ